MQAESAPFRYEMINVQTGFVVVEHEIFSKAMRSYFSPGPSSPVEEYREGTRIWKPTATAQSFRFDVRDRESGDVLPFDELLGLAFWGSCPKESEIHLLGDIAQEHRISIYVAVTFDAAAGAEARLDPRKLRALNGYFNERLRDPEKKILILPDLFNLRREFSHGHIMVDLGLTAMEPAGSARRAGTKEGER